MFLLFLSIPGGRSLKTLLGHFLQPSEAGRTRVATHVVADGALRTEVPPGLSPCACR